MTVLVGVVAQFLKQSRESQDRTEILLAQLEDARDEQARAAAIAERGRIASELHDVLAHSLSGAAIQLQGARKLAERATLSRLLAMRSTVPASSSKLGWPTPARPSGPSAATRYQRSLSSPP